MTQINEVNSSCSNKAKYHHIWLYNLVYIYIHVCIYIYIPYDLILAHSIHMKIGAWHSSPWDPRMQVTSEATKICGNFQSQSALVAAATQVPRVPVRRANDDHDIWYQWTWTKIDDKFENYIILMIKYHFDDQISFWWSNIILMIKYHFEQLFIYIYILMIFLMIFDDKNWMISWSDSFSTTEKLLSDSPSVACKDRLGLRFMCIASAPRPWVPWISRDDMTWYIS